MPIPSEEETMKMLAAEPQCTIEIRKDENNPNYVTERCYVNGVCYLIEVGKEVTVPKTIKEMLKLRHII